MWAVKELLKNSALPSFKEVKHHSHSHVTGILNYGIVSCDYGISKSMRIFYDEFSTRQNSICVSF